MGWCCPQRWTYLQLISHPTSIFPPLTTWTLKTPLAQNEAVCRKPVSAGCCHGFHSGRNSEGRGEGWEEKWACHVTVTLRSCDFFGRVVINPQEVMMALSPEERLIHTHTRTHTHTHTHTHVGRTARRDRPHDVIRWLKRLLMLYRNP